jgi:hypothetical protein
MTQGRFMKFFTAGWYVEDDDADRIEHAYERHLKEILAHVRYPARAYMEAGISLHDALVYSCVASDGNLEVRVVGGDLRMGYFDLETRYLAVSIASVLPESNGRLVEILYDEFDFADTTRTALRHSFISARKREYTIVFENLDFTMRRTTGDRYMELHRMRE